MKNVRINASEIKILVGGICCVPMACRINENTIIKRKKLVIINKSDGAKASKVKTIITFKLATKLAGVSGALRLRFMLGIFSAPKEQTNKPKSKKMLFKSYPSAKIGVDIS